MQIPVWLKPGIWGAVVGAVLTAIVGFSQLGWTTSSTAQQLAQKRADAAVVAALVPFCVAKAEQDPDKNVLTKFRAQTEGYARSDLVMKAGWATVGDQKSPDSALARACSEKLNGTHAG